MRTPVRHRREVERAGQLLRVGDTLPLPKPKLAIRPASWADDTARSPRGVFHNGRGRS